MSASNHDAGWREEDKLRAGEYNPWEKKLRVIAKKREVSNFMDEGYLNMINQLRAVGELSTAEFMRISGGDERLRGIIEEGCTDLYRGYIVDCNNSVEALRILREKSLPHTGEEKWNATNELGSVNLNYEAGFEDYVARFENAVRKLSGAGVPLDNQMRDARFITGLGVDMETTRSTLRAMSAAGNSTLSQFIQVAKMGYTQLMKGKPDLFRSRNKAFSGEEEKKNTNGNARPLNGELLGKLALALMGQIAPHGSGKQMAGNMAGNKRKRCKECGMSNHEFEDCFENKASSNYRGDEYARSKKEHRRVMQKYDHDRGSRKRYHRKSQEGNRDGAIDLTESDEAKALAAVYQMIQDGK
jgi:hypothetical protein